MNEDENRKKSLNDVSHNYPLEAALDYAKRGWPVFPIYEISNTGHCACGDKDCPSPGKHPRTHDGFKSATTDIEQIRRWWKEWPKANIGIETGHRSGLCVLDIDKKHGGLQSLTRLEELYEELPINTVASTGGGGLHFYFRYPNSISIKSRSTALGEQFPGIDMRADTAYIIGPPSTHISGKTHCWMNWEPLPEIPDWLIKLLTNDNPRTIQATSDAIVEGTRNTILTSLAGKYRSLGFSEKVIAEMLLDGNQKFCQPPLTEREVLSIAHSISSYPPGQATAAIRGDMIDILQARWLYLNQFEAQEVCWLWEGLIAIGKLTLVVGNPGLGKSWVLLFIAAKVTTGEPWPNLFGRRAPRSVIILSGEDSPNDTILPRFEACGGDSSRVVFWEGMYDSEGTDHFVDLKRDIHGLEALIQQHKDIGLLIIDPLSAFLGGTDTHVDARVRSVLGPLAKIAEENEIAVVGVCHLNKSQQKNIVYKPGGSIAFVAAARSVILVTPNPKVEESRLFHLIKTNLTAYKFGLSFRIEDDRVVFESDEVSLTEAELMEAITAKRKSPQTDRAVEWFTEYFKKNLTPVKSRIVLEEAKKAGHTEYVIGRARTILNIKRTKVGNDENGYWAMYLPEENGNELAEGQCPEDSKVEGIEETEEID
jgi:hypothetical protein